jgi:hypothetical protein
MKKAATRSDPVADVHDDLKKYPQWDLRFPILLEEVGAET